VRRAFLAALLLIALAVTYGYAVTRREGQYRQFVQQGDSALAQGDTSAAIEAFSGAIALKADSMVAYLRRGEAYLRRAELQSALRDLRKAAELDPTAPRPCELLGDVNDALERYARAAQHYQAYISLDDQSPRVLYKLGLAHYRAGQLKPAVDALQKAIALNAGFAEAHYLLGLCHRDGRRTRDALVSLERATALAPAMLQAREVLADLYRRVGRADDRIAQLEVLLALDPSPSREVALGLAYARLGESDRAVRALRRAVERYPQHGYSYVALGRIWLEIAQARDDRIALGKAIEALEDAVGSDNSSEALTLFGRALLMAGEEPLAERMLQQAAAKLPADPLAFFYLADVADRRGHLEVARQALLDYRSLESDERDPRRRASVATRIADLSLRLDDAPAAVGWYQYAATQVALDPASLVRYAEAQWRSGYPDEARTLLDRLLERDPTHVAARTLRRRVR
jgi:tetratricopeptide (TPR) repeat protein